MKTQWNIKRQKEVGRSRPLMGVKEIHIELKNIVTAFFNDYNHPYHELDLITKYQSVFETTTYLFEDYRKDYEKNLLKRYTEINTEEQLIVECIVFCSWLSLEVMTALSKIERI